MTDASSKPSFDPVLLDLSDEDDYAVIIQALEEFQGVMQGDADDEHQRIRHHNLPESESNEAELQSYANRASRIRAEIERQLDANADARGKAG